MIAVDGAREGLCRRNRMETEMDESYESALGGKMEYRPRGRKPPKRDA